MMRDLTKAMLRFSWAMSLFGVKQMTSMMMPSGNNPPLSEVTESFNAVTEATEEQLGQMFKDAFKAGDTLQKSVTDLSMKWASMESFDANQILRWPMDMSKMLNEGLKRNTEQRWMESGAKPNSESGAI
jgi:hypothetical protein